MQERNSYIDNYQLLITKLDQFIRKYYKNRMIKGAIIALFLLLLSFLLLSTLEYFGHFGTLMRTLFFYSYLILNAAIISYYFINPLLKLNSIGNRISHKQASEIIGSFFTHVEDKLLNTLQLKEMADYNPQSRELIEASINQRIGELKPVPFTTAINLRENIRYLRYLFIPLLIIMLIIIAGRQAIITESTARIISHNKHFEKPMPFQFVLMNDSLTSVKGEDFTVTVKLEGDRLPDKLYIDIDGREYPMRKSGQETYQHTFNRLRKAHGFNFVAGQYLSRPYKLKLIPKAVLLGFDVYLSYPAYINKANEKLQSRGDLTIPEGTHVKWVFNTSETDILTMQFADTTLYPVRKKRSGFEISKSFRKSNSYTVRTANKFMQNPDSVQYFINIIPDVYPRINVSRQEDSINKRFLFFMGEISDDYGLSRLAFRYKFSQSEDTSRKNKIYSRDIAINRANIYQAFIYSFDLNDIGVLPGDVIEYYFEVWDNDGVNGSKSSNSQKYYYQSPSLDQVNKETEKLSEDMKADMSDMAKKAQDLQKDLLEARKKLMQREELMWEDKQFIENILDKQKELEKRIEEMQNNFIENVTKQDDYKGLNKETLDKYKELYDKLQDLIPDEMKKLLEELQKLMEQNMKNQLEQELDKLSKNQKDMERELERLLEQYKRLEFSIKMDDVIDQLEKLAEKQENLSEETEKAKTDPETLEEKQEQLNEEFEKFEEEYEKLEKLNDQLENPHNMDDTEEDREDIKKDQQEGLENIQQKQMKKGSEKQRKSSEKMQELAEKMKAMKMDMEGQELEINYQKLRRLLENLLHVSFEQESLAEELKQINNYNPQYVELAQRQRKVHDDLKMIEDSLFALSKELPMIHSFINKQVNDINFHLADALELLSDRKIPQARARQQYVMTSVNDVAVMLSEILKQMQDQMDAMAKGSGKKKKDKKPGLSDLSKMQEELSKQLQDMKDGKTPQGQQMSQELARMAAMQEMIREALRKLEQSKIKEGGKPDNTLKEIQELMEQIEKDIVNKRITEETIRRQKDVTIKLLEAEKAEREQEKEERRESRTAREIFNQNPPSIDEYLKNKQKEVELLETVPPTLSPYYRLKVKEYFKLLPR